MPRLFAASNLEYADGIATNVGFDEDIHSTDDWFQTFTPQLVLKVITSPKLWALGFSHTEKRPFTIGGKSLGEGHC